MRDIESMPPPLSILDAASYILKNAPWTITLLELQHLLYLAQMFHLGEYDYPLVAARFQAWQYGPTNQALFNEAKRYGTDVLISSNFPGNWQAVVAQTHKKILDDVVRIFSDKTLDELMQLTRLKGGAWAATFNPRYQNIDIPDRLIRGEYVERWSQALNQFIHAETGPT